MVYREGHMGRKLGGDELVRDHFDSLVPPVLGLIWSKLFRSAWASPISIGTIQAVTFPLVAVGP